MPDEFPENPSVVRDLLAYFLRHPDARGTLQNLTEWRIREEVAHRTAGEVDAALDWLVREPRALVRRDEAPPSPPVFRLNETRIDEAVRLLARLSADRAGHASPPAAFPRQPPSGTALMSTVVAWIDSTLARYDREHPAANDDQLGIARDPRTIQRLLSHIVAPEGPDRDQPTLADDTRALIEAIDASHANEPIPALCRNLGLTTPEIQVLLLTFAAELDAKYHAVFGILNDDMGRRSVTLGLACAILGDPSQVRQDLQRSGGLIRWRLLDSGASFPHADDPLRLDPSIIGWLFDDRHALAADPRISGYVKLDPWTGAGWLRTSAEADLVRALRDRFASSVERWTAIVGGEKNGSHAAVERAAADRGDALLRVVLPTAPIDLGEVDEIIARLARAAHVHPGVTVVDTGRLGADALGPGGVARLFEAVRDLSCHLVIVSGEIERLAGALPRRPGACLHVELPAAESLAAVYEAGAAEAGLRISESEAERLAASFPLPFDAIEKAIGLAVLTARETDLAWDRHFSAIFDACRRVSSPDLPRFGRRVEPVFTLDDVVLPAEQRTQMDEIVSHVRYAPHVMQRWGFGEQLPYGRGVAALFSGPSGTGKTMAAQAIARALGTDAYVVDLSRVVSKYIGESEKNLEAVFEDAERSGAVLVFDEADALFGKRSEIKDAHDRYANIEVAYLLQRMEAFAGLAILTTNFRQNLDPAFVRRLRFIVEFRKPDERAREAIWRRSLSARAPVSRRVNLQFLARRLDLTGGTIQQIAIRAAFAAASDRSNEIDMRHVMAAARAELLKVGLAAAERELAAFDTAFRRDAGVASRSV